MKRVFLLFVVLFVAAPARAEAPTTLPSTCYLFASFRGNGEDGLHLACSADGLNWAPLKGDKSFLQPHVGSEKLMRDPCVLVGPDGEFHMVWTTGWRGHDIGYAHSKDLVHWSEQQAIPVMGHEPTAINCWAPEIVYDDAAKHYLIFWSTTIPGRFPETDGTGDGGSNHRIYSTTTSDFVTFTPTKLFFDPGYNVIDATMVHEKDRYYLIFKQETLKPLCKFLRIASSEKIDGPFEHISEPLTAHHSEGPTAIRIGTDYVVYYDKYTRNAYGAARSSDLKTWTDISNDVHIPRGTRHGTVIEAPRAVLDRLIEE